MVCYVCKYTKNSKHSELFHCFLVILPIILDFRLPFTVGQIIFRNKDNEF